MTFFHTVVMLLPQVNVISGVTPFYRVTVLWIG